MAITRVKLENFTVFESLDLEPSPGINVLVGANGTGKTHLMKVCYAACGVTKFGTDLMEKLLGIFLPSGRYLQRLVFSKASNLKMARINVHFGEETVEGDIEKVDDGGFATYSDNSHAWAGEEGVESVYIPVKEMLSNAPGFRSLYAFRDIHFEEVYKGILDKAYLPALREQPSTQSS